MKFEISYENHLGETLDVNGAGIYIDASSFDNWEWKYSLLNGRVAGFYREPVEISAPVTIIAKSEEAGLLCRDALYRIAEKDVLAKRPGRMVYNGWYMRCYVVSSSKDMHWYDGAIAEYELRVLAESPVWVRDHELSLPKNGYGIGLNFPYNFPYNFAGASKDAPYIENPGIDDAAIVATVYGPASNPYITIGGNRYEVAVEVKSGGKLVIDSDNRTITLYDEYGNTENVFSKRRGVQRAGSGSFVFQKVPPGMHRIAWDGSFALSILLHERQSERRWID